MNTAKPHPTGIHPANNTCTGIYDFLTIQTQPQKPAHTPHTHPPLYLHKRKLWKKSIQFPGIFRKMLQPERIFG
jgi:hypothetical protein